MVGDFGLFFAEHYADVVRALTFTVGRQSLGDDLAQEAFARALQRWDSFGPGDRPAAWVYVVAMNLARDELRRGAVSSPPPGPERALSDVCGVVATAVTVRSMLLALPFRQRQAVVLRYFADL